MAKPRLNLYADVKHVLDEALASGGGQYVLATYGAAVHWRQRAYKFRKAYAAENAASPYDALTFPRIDEGTCTVKIEVNKPKGLFVANEAAPNFDTDAEALAAKLRGDLI